MSLLFILALAQAAATPPAQAPAAVAAPAPVQQKVKPKKPKPVCEYVEVTGSHSRERVCTGDDPNLALLPGISHSTVGIKAQHGSAGVDGSRSGLSTN